MILFGDDAELKQNGNIYTASYFAPLNHYHGRKMIVSNSVPKDMDMGFYIKLESFVPPWKIVNAFKKDEITWDEYKKEYLDFLNKRDRDFAQREMFFIKDVLSVGEDITFCCWEKDAGYCHRRLIVEWLGTKGFEIDKSNIK
jgi:uncharacterized protein YeaO (DUF488 family)